MALRWADESEVDPSPRGTSATGDFDSAMERLFKVEGGYVNNPADRGGETNFGISKKNNPDVDVANLTRDQAKGLYRQRYWDAINADQLPASIREVAFDSAVNHGVGATQKMLQQAGGDPDKLIALRRQKYQNIVESDPSQAQFANGWENRLKGLSPVASAKASSSLKWADEYEPEYSSSPADPSKSGNVGTFVRNFIQAAPPAIAGITAGFTAGGLAAPTGPVGAFAAMAGAGMGVGQTTAMAQEKFYQEHPTIAKLLGQDPDQRAYDQAFNPNIAFAGQLAPNLVAFRPSALPFRRITEQTAPEVANAIRGARLAGGLNAGVAGGTEVGFALANDQPVDLTRVAMSAAVGLVSNKPTALGRGLARLGEAPLPQSMRTFTAEPDLPSASPLDMIRRQMDARETAAARPQMGEQGSLFDAEATPIIPPPPDTPASAMPGRPMVQPTDPAYSVAQPDQLNLFTGQPDTVSPDQIDMFAPPRQESAAPELGAPEPNPNQTEMFGQRETVRAQYSPTEILRQIRNYVGTPESPAPADSYMLRLSSQIGRMLRPDGDNAATVRNHIDSEITRLLGEEEALKVQDERLQVQGSGQQPGKANNWQKKKAALDKKAAELKKQIETLSAVDDALPTIISRFSADMGVAAKADAAPKVEYGLQQAEQRIMADDTAGVRFGEQAPPPDGTVEQMRSRNVAETAKADDQRMREAVRATDERVAAAEAERAAKQRDEILQRILDDPDTLNPTARFRAELRKVGVKEVNPSPDEVIKIGRFEDAKAAFTAKRQKAEKPAERVDDGVEYADTPPTQRDYLDLESQIPERTAPVTPRRVNPALAPENFELAPSPGAKDMPAIERAQAKRDARAVRDAEANPEPLQDFGPEPAQGELFTQRGKPTKQAEGTSQRQLVDEANRVISEIRGTKSREVMDEVVALYNQRDVDLAFVTDAATRLKGGRYASVTRDVQGIKQAVEQARAKTPTPEQVIEPVVAEPVAAEPVAPPRASRPARVQTESESREATSLRQLVGEAVSRDLIDDVTAANLLRQTREGDLDTVRIAIAKAARQVGEGVPKDAPLPVKPVVDPVTRPKVVEAEVAAPAEFMQAEPAVTAEPPAPVRPAERTIPESMRDDPSLPTQERVSRQAARAQFLRNADIGKARARDGAPQNLRRMADGDDDGLRFRKEDGVRAGVREDEARQVVKELTDGWKNGPETIVVDTIDQLPMNLRSRADEMVKGFITADNKQVYVIAANHSSAGDVRATVFHEGLGHRGLAETFTRRLDEVMTAIYDTNPQMRKSADRWMQRREGDEFYAEMPQAKRRARAIEEILAEASEQGQFTAPGIKGAVSRLGALIREFGRRIGIVKEYSDNDVLDILRRAHKSVVDGPPGGPGARAREMAQTTEAVRARDPDAQPKANSRGNPIANTAEGVRNFFRWFGKSKIVDDSGRPQVMYHGTTKDITSFKRGEDVQAIFVTSNTAVANRFAGALKFSDSPLAFNTDAPNGSVVYPLYVRAENPFDYQNPSHVRAVVDALHPMEEGMSRSEVLRRKAVEDMLTAGDWARIEAPEVQDAILDAGHDGFYIDEFGTKNLAVYSPKQLKSASGNSGEFNPNTSDIRYRTIARQEVVAANIERLPPRLQSPVRRFLDYVEHAVDRGITTVGFTENIAAAASKVGVKSADNYVRVNGERTKIANERETKVEDILNKVQPLVQAERQALNAFLEKSTREGKWGYKPDHLSEPATIDPEMARMYNALPATAQEVVRDVFRHGAETLRLKQDGVVRTIADEFSYELGLIDPAIKTRFDRLLSADREGASNAMAALVTEVRGTPNEAAVKKLKNSYASKITTFESLMKIDPNSPYAPLKRDGNFVAAGMSDEFRRMEQAVEDGTAKAADLDKLRADPDHYFVDFYESSGLANEAADRLQKKYGFAEAFQKDDAANHLGASRDQYLAFQSIQKMLLDGGEAFADGKSLTAVRRLVSDLYLKSLAESSARKSELQRLKVASDPLDMMRSFATQGRADAHLLANLHKNGELLDTITAMRKEVRSREMPEKRGERQMYFNELLRRYAEGMSHKNMRVSDGINRATSLWMLATSPSYYLQNLSQPVMMSLPYMAGTHGYYRSAKLLQEAYGDLGQMIGSAKLTERMDLTKVPDDVKLVIEELAKRGRIDIGIEQDLGKFYSYKGDAVSTAWNRVDQGLRNVAQKAETINRLATAIAGYRAAKGRGASTDKALRYADDVILTTHGSYDGFNAPRFLNTPTGKVLGQFRKFQLIQLAMMAKLVKNSFAKGPEQAAARKALGYVLAHTGVMGGALGLPGMAAIKFLFEAMVSDDDDPVDLELEARRVIGDPGVADLLMRGVPAAAGVDTSAKFGWGQMLSPLPFAEPSMSRKGYESMLVSATGPFFGGLLPRAFDGIGLMASGDHYKGLEQLLPTGFSAAAKAYRYASDGVTQRSGDTVLTPDELSALEIISTAVGLKPSKLVNQTFSQNVMREFTEGFNAAAGDIKHDYQKAVKDGDTAAQAEARNRWQRLQESRAKNGFKRQPLSDLMKSVSAQKQRERRVTGGVEFTPQSRGLATELAELTGA
jgi:hypothetical protein